MSSAESSPFEISAKSQVELDMTAGTGASFLLPIINDEEDPSAFEPRFEGTGAAWAAGNEPRTVIKGNSRGKLGFKIDVPPDALTARYRVVAAVAVNGSIDETYGPITIDLQVQGLAKPPEPTLEPAPAPAPAPAPPSPEPEAETPVAEKKPTPKPKPAPAPIEAPAADAGVPSVSAEVKPPASEPEVSPAPVAAAPAAPVPAAPITVEPTPTPIEPIVVSLPEAPIVTPPTPVAEVPATPTPAAASPAVPNPAPASVPNQAPKPAPGPVLRSTSVPTTPTPAKEEPEVAEEIVFKSQTRPKPEPAPTPAPVPQEKPIPVIRSAAPPEEESRRAEPEPSQTADPRLSPANYDECLVDPDHNSVIPVRPGMSVLVLLNFVSGPNGGHYVLEVKDDLQPDRDARFVTLIRQEVDPAPNKPEQLAFRMDVPKAEPPQDYRVRIARGAAAKMDRSVIVLRVLPTIQLEVQSETRKVVVGPVRSFADFKVAIANKGNVATAYRLSARRSSDAGNTEDVLTFPDRESDGQWHYLFDLELQNLPKDLGALVNHRFRMLWQGIWWLGWTSKQKVSVVASPVTDPSNNRTTGHVVDLVGMRWRLLPLPWFVGIPLLFVLIVFFAAMTASISDVVVMNAPHNDEFYYVVQHRADSWRPTPQQDDVTLNADLSWKSKLPWAHLTSSGTAVDITSDGGSRTGQATVHLEKSPSRDVEFEVASLFGAKREQLQPAVRFVTVRTHDAIGFVGFPSSGSDFSLPGAPGIQRVHIAEAKDLPGGLSGIELDLRVTPGDRVKLTMHNSDSSNSINLFLYSQPNDYEVDGGGLSLKDPRSVPPLRDGLSWVLTPKPGANLDAGGDEFIVVTSDAVAPMIRVKLLPGNTP